MPAPTPVVLTHCVTAIDVDGNSRAQFATSLESADRLADKWFQRDGIVSVMVENLR